MKLASYSLAAALFGFSSISLPVQAQSRPYGDEGQTRTSDPYLSAPNNVTDYPAAEVRAVPAAKARRAIALVERDEAYNTMSRALRQSERDMKNSEGMAAAMDEERLAFVALEQARDKALSSLTDDEKYQVRRSIQAELGKRISERRYEPATSPQSADVSQLASAKLDLAKEARQKEASLLAKSPEVTAARGRLMAARARVRELQDSWRDEVRNDPDLLAARQKVIDTKIAHLAAEAYLDGVVEARNIAMNYAYYLQRYNPYQTSSYYDPYAYRGSSQLSRYTMRY